MTKTEKKRRAFIKKHGAAAYQRMIWTKALENRRGSVGFSHKAKSDRVVTD